MQIHKYLTTLFTSVLGIFCPISIFLKINLKNMDILPHAVLNI